MLGINVANWLATKPSEMVLLLEVTPDVVTANQGWLVETLKGTPEVVLVIVKFTFGGGVPPT